MKIKQLTKNFMVILFLTILTLSIFSFVGCKDKKEETENKPETFQPIELTTEQVQTIFDNAIEKMNQAESIYTNLGEDLYAIANDEIFYKKYEYYSDEYTENWYIYDNSSWVRYSYREDASGNIDLARKSTETGDITQTTNYIQAFIYEYIFIDFYQFNDMQHTLVKTGTQTAKSIYKLSFLFSDIEGLDGVTYEIKVNVNDGYINNLKVVITDNGQVDIVEKEFLYNVNDVVIPELPNVSWSNK